MDGVSSAEVVGASHSLGAGYSSGGPAGLCCDGRFSGRTAPVVSNQFQEKGEGIKVG